MWYKMQNPTQVREARVCDRVLGGNPDHRLGRPESKHRFRPRTTKTIDDTDEETFLQENVYKDRFRPDLVDDHRLHRELLHSYIMCVYQSNEAQPAADVMKRLRDTHLR